MLDVSNPFAESRARPTYWSESMEAPAYFARVKKVLVRERYICWSLIAGSNIDEDLYGDASSHLRRGYWWLKLSAFSYLYLIFVNYLLIYRPWLAVLKLFPQSFPNFFTNNQNKQPMALIPQQLWVHLCILRCIAINEVKRVIRKAVANYPWRLITIIWLIT